MGKHLDFYYKSLGDGVMSTAGLCEASARGFISKEILKKLTPSNADFEELQNEGKIKYDSDINGSFWACGLGVYGIRRAFTFTTLRQTIVLFMAAINEEL